jgi:Lrp/AsnC family transcriptional regulator for asnA, asnC and gidA
LEKKGVVTGATIQMNFEAFGFDALATLLMSVETQKLEEAVSKINKIRDVLAYKQYNSQYNVRAFATLRNLNELDKAKEAVRRNIPVIGFRTYIWTDVRNTPEHLKLNPQQTSIEVEGESEESVLDEKKQKTFVDKMDLAIVEKLTVDGRTSFNKVAQAIGTSTDTVAKRYKRLVQSNIIKVSIQIDPKKIGYKSIVDFNIAFSFQGDSFKTITELGNISDVIIITKISGDYDIQLTAMVRNLEQIFSMQDQISRLSGIAKMEVSARKIPDKWPTPHQYLSTF